MRGLYLGHSIGAPAGAHLANRSRGSVVASLAASSAAAAAALLLRRADGHTEEGRAPSRGLLIVVAMGVPVTQLASVLVERATTRRD